MAAPAMRLPVAAARHRRRVWERRYHGVFAPHTKNRAAYVPKKPAPEELEKTRGKSANRLLWAALLARTFGLNMEVCAHCGGKMRFVAALTDPALYMALGLVQQRNAEKIAVRSLINRDVIFIREDDTCENAIRLFVAHPIVALPVVDAAHSVVGILSETDLLVETNFKKRVAEIMTTDVISIQEDFSVARVVRLFRSRNLRVFPVVSEKNRLIGVIGRKDILKYYMNYAELRYVV